MKFAGLPAPRAVCLGAMLTLAALFHPEAKGGTEPPKKQPNIVLLVLDDMGFSDIQANGGEIPTPNMNALGSSGLLFSNFHSHAACSPTRSMLLTGADNHRIGLGTMEGSVGKNQQGKPGYSTVLNQDALPVSQILRDAGYHTYMTGKWHLGGDKGFWPVDRGFEESFVLIPGGASHYSDATEYAKNYEVATYARNGTVLDKLPADFYSTKNFTDEAIGFIDKNKADNKPFFLYLAYTAPHSPVQMPDEKLIQHYESIYAKGWDAIRAERLQRQQASGLIPMQVELPKRLANVKAWNELTPDEQKIEARKMAVYAAMIDYLDASIGRFVQHLKDIGAYDNTLIVLFTDNGADAHNNSEGKFKKWIVEHNFDNSYQNIGKPNSFVSISPGWAQVSATPFRGSKGAVTEGGIRAGCLVSYPAAIPGGRRTDAVTSVIDVTPTLLDYAGVPVPGATYKGKPIVTMDGHSMRPLWDGKSDSAYKPDQPVFFELYGRVNKALYLGEWKILRIGDEPFGPGEQARWELFNLHMDPGEAHDLSAMYPDLKKKMITMYKEREKEVGFVPARLPGEPEEKPKH